MRALWAKLTHFIGRSPTLAVQETRARPPSVRPRRKAKGSMRGATKRGERERGETREMKNGDGEN